MTATGAPSRRNADGQVVGALLVLAGVFWLLQRSGVVDLSWRTMVSVLLVTLGIGMVMTARRGHGGGVLIAIGVAMTIVLVSTSSIDIGVLKEGVGERTVRPVTLEAAAGADALGVGQLAIDLRDLQLPPGERSRLKYSMGVGELDIALPAGVPVRVVGSMRGGEMELLGQQRNGTDLRAIAEDVDFDTAETTLEIVVTMGFGNMRVSHAGL